MQIAILVFEHVADSGLGLLQDVFAAANVLAGRVSVHTAGFDVVCVGTSSRVRTGYGLIASPRPLTTLLDDPPDHVVVPSLGVVTAEHVVGAVTSYDVRECLGQLHERDVAISAACSGVFFLAEAGLLARRRATTSWWLGPAFRARYPDVELDETQALVISDTVTTAGAALAHLDLALALVRRVSPILADAVGDYLAVGDRPQQGQFIRPSILATSDPILTGFDRAVRDHIAEPIDVGRLAADLGVSERTLQRMTSATLGMSPVRYVQQVRLERAVDLLRGTDLTVTSIAHAVGYQDATTLGTLMRRRRGTTPEQIRRRRLIDGHAAR